MLPYSQATLQQLRQDFGIRVETRSFLPPLIPLALPGWLNEYLAVNELTPAFTRSEKAISELLIAPVLTAVKQYHADKISLFSGEALTGTDVFGICDFIIASNPNAYLPEPPIMVLVEAKKQDLYGAIPQCIAEMRAAQQVNAQAGYSPEAIYGCVTIGSEWLFLQLKDTQAFTHPHVFYYPQLDEVLAVFRWIIAQFIPA